MIVEYREKKGRFNNRIELMNVDKLGAKAFEQCAGFLRINGGDEPLDRTGVHPESYEATNKLLKNLKFSKKDLINGNFAGIGEQITDYEKTAKELKIGVETLKDIVNELEKPGRDPRSDAPKPILRSDVLSMEDLQEGMLLKGTVRNSTDFGVFVDIGVHQDGLVHISQIADKFVKHPLDVVSIGDIVDVKVLSVDLDKKRISLTMRLDGGGVKDYREMHKSNQTQNSTFTSNINANTKVEESEIDSVKLAKEMMKNKKSIAKVKISVASADDEKEEVKEVKKKKTTTKKETSKKGTKEKETKKKATGTKKTSSKTIKKATTKETTTKKASTEKTITKKTTAKKDEVKKTTAKKTNAKKTSTKKS